jgi:hypothetical protein
VKLISPEHWQKLVPKLRAACPRLTEQDFAEAAGRLDLAVAKLQNRQWCDRRTAQRLVYGLVAELTP